MPANTYSYTDARSHANTHAQPDTEPHTNPGSDAYPNATWLFVLAPGGYQRGGDRQHARRNRLHLPRAGHHQ